MPQEKSDRRPVPTTSQPDVEGFILKLETGLAIDEHALDEALIRQPDLYYRVSKQLAHLISRRDAAEEALEDAMAQADKKLRKVARNYEDKTSNPELAALKRLEPDVKDARKVFLGLKHYCNLIQALEKAYSQRGYALKELTKLHMANYFGDPSNVSTREMTHLATRREMNKVRRETEDDFRSRERMKK